jgi:hypothetical protein
MSEKMVNHVAVSGVMVMREGKRVHVRAGQAFDFTQGEIDDLKEVEKKTGRTVVRTPVVEGTAGGVAPKVANDFAKLCAKAEEAAAAAAKKPGDAALKKKAEDAKAKAVEMAKATGLQLPDGLGEDKEL